MKVEILDKDYGALIGIINNLRNLIATETSTWMSENPCWDPRDDLRVSLFWKLKGTLDPLLLILIYNKGILTQDSFWKENFEFDKLKETTIDPRDNMMSSVEMFVKIAFVQVYFSVMESTFRLLLTAIGSSAAGQGTAHVESVYLALLKKIPSTPPNSIEMLSMWRIVRNSIHHNGRYVPKSNQALSEISYRGNKYSLLVGQQLNWITWNFILQLALDSYELMKVIVRDPAIRNLQHQIIDPSPATW